MTGLPAGRYLSTWVWLPWLELATKPPTESHESLLVTAGPVQSLEASPARAAMDGESVVVNLMQLGAPKATSFCKQGSM